MSTDLQLKLLEDTLVKRVFPSLNRYLSFRGNSLSKLDPKNGVDDVLGELFRISQHLYLCHRENKEDSNVLREPQILDYYSALLKGLINTLFRDVTTPIHFGLNIELTRCVTKIYEYLYTAAAIVDNGKLNSIVHSFQRDFQQSYNSVDQDTLFFDQVRDFQSHSLDLIAPPLFSISDVLKRGLFKLSCTKFEYDEMLVEIFHLNDGTVAVFKVNSQRPLLVSGRHVHDFLMELATYDDLSSSKISHTCKIGRTLLFPNIRRKDLRIIEERGSLMKLGTKTGNNVVLEITAFDILTWRVYWRSVFIELCADLELPNSQQLKASAHILTTSDGSEEFAKCANKDKSIGLGIALNSQVELKTSGLRKTKPLSNFNRFDPYLEALDSYSSVEMELSENIGNEVSPPPSELLLKSVQAEVSTKEISPVIGRLISDNESIISDHSSISESKSNDGHLVDKVIEDEFSLSTEFYKPQLTKRKSSSLLSLFKKDKGTKPTKPSIPKGLTIDTSFSVPTVGLASSTLTPTPTSSMSSAPELPSAVTLPLDLELDTSLTLLESTVKISHWYGDSWKLVSSNWLKLKIVNSNKGVQMLLVQDELLNTKCCIAITNNLKVSRFTAQDIQIRFTPQDVIASVLPQNITLLSVRCPQIKVLLNVLNHCLKAKNPDSHKLPTSSTQMTIRSNSSSITSTSKSSERFSRSSTNSTSLSLSVSELESSEVEESKSLLLLAKIKVRLHKYDDNYGWKLDKVGILNISSYELRGLVKGCKFELADSESFYSPFDKMKRIGRTGITIGERLIEFKKQSVADEVFEVIRRLDHS